MTRKHQAGAVIAFLALLTGNGPCAAAGPAQARLEQSLLPAVRIEGRPMPAWSLAERMAHYRVPGVGIALIENGAVAWAGGYGVLHAGQDAPVSADTRFQAASLSKLIAATLTLQQVEAGRLGLDEDVNHALRNWTLPRDDSAGGAPVTPALLLAHRAGVSVSGFEGYAQGAPLPDLGAVLDGRAPANSAPVRVTAAPGSAGRYSGGGYMVLQQLIEDVAGQPFEALAQASLFQPLRMERSGYVTPTAGVACGHGYDGRPLAGCGNRYPEAAAAGLWSTPADMAAWALALSAAYRGEHASPLRPGTARRMLSPLVAGGDVALGPGVHGKGAGLHFDHAGSNRGFRAYLLMFPETGGGIVVMTNGDGGQELIGEIVRGAASLQGWPGFEPRQRSTVRLPAAQLDARAGDYQAGAFRASVSRVEDHLLLRTPRGTTYAFHPSSGTDYFALEDGSTLVFAEQDGRPVMHLWGMTAVRCDGGERACDGGGP